MKTPTPHQVKFKKKGKIKNDILLWTKQMVLYYMHTIYLIISSARQYSQRNKFLANIYQPQFSDNIMD